MTLRVSKAMLAGAGALVLAACEGSTGGGGLVSTPTPPPAPTPTPAPAPTPTIAGTTDPLVPGAGTQPLQNFETTMNFDGSLRFHYDAATGQYSVTGPYATDPMPLVRSEEYVPPPGEHHRLYVPAPQDGSFIEIHASSASPHPELRYTYSNLATWSYGPGMGDRPPGGTTAFGVTTPAEAMPRTGTATYSGIMRGHTDEYWVDDWGAWSATLSGTVELTADFASANLSGNLMPTLHMVYEDYSLGTIPMASMNWGVGLPFFGSPASAGQPGSPAIVWGAFAGPSAQEVMGSFRFLYTSPVDDGTHAAAGGFIAKQP